MPKPILPPLPCPACIEDGCGGGARIGNRRTDCATCNNFARNVTRLTQQALAREHPEDYARIRNAVEVDLYRKVLAAFDQQQPWVRGFADR